MYSLSFPKMSNSWLLPLFLLTIAFVKPAEARIIFCVDNANGTCEIDPLFGWCFHNKTSGAFNCDDGGFCAGKETIRNKVMSGCFNTNDNQTVCCCNESEGCNIAFTTMPPVDETHTQKCAFSHEEPHVSPKNMRPCDDPWCYTYMTAEVDGGLYTEDSQLEVDGGLTTVYRGCQSRTMIKHHMYKQLDEMFNNDTRWKDYEHLNDMPRCEDIAWHGDDNNGTISRCVDYEWIDDREIEHRGRLCCCKGKDKCNSGFSWGNIAITAEEVTENREKRLYALAHPEEENDASTASILLSIVPLISLLLQ